MGITVENAIKRFGDFVALTTSRSTCPTGR